MKACGGGALQQMCLTLNPEKKKMFVSGIYTGS